MLCRGELDVRGAVPSELAVPFDLLFPRLRRYGVEVRESPTPAPAAA